MIRCPVCNDEAFTADATVAEFHERNKGSVFQAMKLTSIEYVHRRGGLVKRCVHHFARPIVLKYQPMSEAAPLVLTPS